MPVLLRYALYALLVAAGLLVLLWVAWQFAQTIADLLAALVIVMAIAVMGAPT